MNGNVFTRISDDERQAAQLILPMIDELMATVGSSLDQLDGIAVAAGPGSFTGIRIGIGVAQGLGMSLTKPVLALSNLAIIAMSAVDEIGCENVVVSLNARNSEVYLASYCASGSAGVTLLGQEQVGTPDHIQALPAIAAEPTNWFAVGDGWDQRDEILRSLQLESGNIQFRHSHLSPELDIRSLCKLANLRFQLGEGVAAEQVMPNYIKVHLDYI